MRGRNKTFCEAKKQSRTQIGEETKHYDSNSITISSNAKMMNSSKSKSILASEDYSTAKD